MLEPMYVTLTMKCTRGDDTTLVQLPVLAPHEVAHALHSSAALWNECMLDGSGNQVLRQSNVQCQIGTRLLQLPTRC
eukprot:607122-Alexandrium_andersonii.AAC.1